MSARLTQLTWEIVPDEDGDTSYLEQEVFEDRLMAYQRGEFGFVGVQAIAQLEIPHGDVVILQEIRSPGLWSIESDSDESYFEEIAGDERAILWDMLAELDVKRLSDEWVTSHE